MVPDKASLGGSAKAASTSVFLFRITLPFGSKFRFTEELWAGRAPVYPHCFPGCQRPSVPWQTSSSEPRDQQLWSVAARSAPLPCLLQGPGQGRLSHAAGESPRPFWLATAALQAVLTDRGLRSFAAITT